MKQVGTSEAKTHFSELLAAVSNGEEFAITKHGEKIALLIPFSSQKQYGSVKGTIRCIKNLRSGTNLERG